MFTKASQYLRHPVMSTGGSCIYDMAFMTPASYLVYEAVNTASREAVVGVSGAADLESVMEEHRRYPPVWVARWGKQKVTYKVVEAGLTLGDAQALAAKYAVAAVWKDFKVDVAG
jgi:transcriptional regulator of nitric oxide reductase